MCLIAQLRRFAGSTLAIASFIDRPVATQSSISRTGGSSRRAFSTRCFQDSAEMRDLIRTSSDEIGSYTSNVDHVQICVSIDLLHGSTDLGRSGDVARALFQRRNSCRTGTAVHVHRISRYWAVGTPPRDFKNALISMAKASLMSFASFTTSLSVSRPRSLPAFL